MLFIANTKGKAILKGPCTRSVVRPWKTAAKAWPKSRGELGQRPRWPRDKKTADSAVMRPARPMFDADRPEEGQVSTAPLMNKSAVSAVMRPFWQNRAGIIFHWPR